MQRVLVKVNNQSPGLYTLVIDRDADQEKTIPRMLLEHGVNIDKGYRIIERK